LFVVLCLWMRIRMLRKRSELWMPHRPNHAQQSRVQRSNTQRSCIQGRMYAGAINPKPDSPLTFTEADADDRVLSGKALLC
jgi:hypothetical protein